MPRSSPTRGWTRQYAKEFLLAGSPPTVSAIRQHIIQVHGVTPSTTTVSNEMVLFWKEVAEQFRSLDEPDRVMSTLELIELPRFQSDAAGNTLPTVTDLTAEITKLQYANLELSARSIRLAGELEQIEKALEEKDKLLGLAVVTSGNASNHAASLEERLAAVSAEARSTLEKKEAEWAEKLTKAEAALRRVEAELNTERQNSLLAQQQLDGARKHLMLETDRVRSQADLANVALKEQLETAKIREGQYLQQRNQALARVDELEQALESIQRQKKDKPTPTNEPAVGVQRAFTAPTAPVSTTRGTPRRLENPDGPEE